MTESESAPQSEEEAPSKQSTPPPASESQKRALKIILIVVGVLVGLSLLGSLLLGWFGWRIGERILEDATGTEITRSRDGDSVTIESRDGDQTFRQSAELPNNLPSSVPIYEPAEVLFSQEINNPDGEAWSILLETNRGGSEVISWYRNALSSDGWSTLSSSDFGGTASISAENQSEQLGINVSITAEQGSDTTINLAVTTLR